MPCHLIDRKKILNALGFVCLDKIYLLWVIKGAKLLDPLLLEMKVELLKNEVLHADETVVEVLNEPGRDATTNSYMWLYRTSGDTNRHVVLYDYTEGRSGSYAKKYLSGFEGYLYTDGYVGITS